MGGGNGRTPDQCVGWIREAIRHDFGLRSRTRVFRQAIGSVLTFKHVGMLELTPLECTMINYIELKQKMLKVEPHRLDRAFWNLSTEFEDSILIAETMPNDAFAFVVDVLTDDRLTKQKGLGHLVRTIYTDFEKLSPLQAGQLLRVFIDNHDCYLDELTRHGIADLIARKYPSEVAFSAFNEILNSKSERAKHIAFVGCDVLRMRRDSPESVKQTAIRMCEEIGRM